MKLFLLGGFLGSGKTTAIQQACMQLQEKDIHAGVITNDQGMQLVDSEFIKGFQIPNREVVNGCFCCNYTQLDDSIWSLKITYKPELIFAESVGSCTDIVAAVVKPLLQFHTDLEIVVSVFADALLLLRMAQGEPAFFDDDVSYIYEKQLEEADVLIVNKTDLLTGEQQQAVAQMIKSKFPEKVVLYQNSLKKSNIQRWLDALQNFDPATARKSIEIDYDAYGAGEAKLAWLDDELDISTENNDAIEISTALINKIYGKIQERNYPIGHLKFLLKKADWQRKISFTSIFEPKLKQTHALMKLDNLNLLINARVQTDPAGLKQVLSDSINEMTLQNHCKIKSNKLLVFNPGYPSPFYRIIN